MWLLVGFKGFIFQSILDIFYDTKEYSTVGLFYAQTHALHIHKIYVLVSHFFFASSTVNKCVIFFFKAKNLKIELNSIPHIEIEQRKYKNYIIWSGMIEIMKMTLIWFTLNIWKKKRRKMFVIGSKFPTIEWNQPAIYIIMPYICFVFH